MRLSSFLRVSFGTALSRILGFVRDMTTASYLGTGGMADAFFLAFRLPNMFRAIFAEGAFNAAFVPLFSKKLASKENAVPFLSNVFAALLSGTLVVVVVMEYFMPSVLGFFAPGFKSDPNKMAASILFARISFPYLCFVSLASFFAAVLNTLNRFFLSSLTPVFLNIFMIGGLWIWASSENAGLVLSCAVLGAGIFQMLFLYAGIRHTGIWPRMGIWPKWDAQLRRLFVLSIPGILSACVTQISLLVSTAIVSQQERGISWLYYADRVCQLPIGLVGVAIGVVLLPDLSKRFSTGDIAGLYASQQRAWLICLALALPAMVGLIILGQDIVTTLFARGAFSLRDVLGTAWALVIISCGIPAYVLIKVLIPSFFAREDMWTPLLISASSVAINGLIGWLTFPFLGYIGCAWGLVLSSWVNVALLLSVLIYRRQAQISWQFLSRLITLLLSVGIMALTLLAMRHFIHLGQTTWKNMMITLLYVSVGAFVYFLQLAFWFGFRRERASFVYTQVPYK